MLPFLQISQLPNNFADNNLSWQKQATKLPNIVSSYIAWILNEYPAFCKDEVRLIVYYVLDSQRKQSRRNGPPRKLGTQHEYMAAIFLSAYLEWDGCRQLTQNFWCVDGSASSAQATAQVEALTPLHLNGLM